MRRYAMVTQDKAAAIAALNDAFRKDPRAAPIGSIVATRGIVALSEAIQQELLLKVQEFTPDNDPHREHDFGSVEAGGVKAFWKIDYYGDPSFSTGAEDPSDPYNSFRVMTIMLADEY
jgi:hypothetical protein